MGASNVIQWATSTSPGVADASKRKKVYRQLVLRWHPDKFESKFGNKTKESDKTKIMEQVQAISQSINQEAEFLKQRGLM